MSAFHNIYLGCETGLLKGVDAEQKTWSNVTTVEKADRQNEIVKLCWNNDNQDEVCIGRRNQTVSVFDTSSCTVVNTFEFSTGKGGPFKGLCKANSDYITCTECGCLRLWSPSGEQKLEISAGENVWCMRNNPQRCHLVATGGKENKLKVWNLERPETPVFTAKNVRHDWLNLRVPEWVTDVAFVPDSQQIISSTNDHEVRVYDMASSCRRPVTSVVFDECPIVSMCLRSNTTHQVFVGNAYGSMALIDLRGKGKVVQQYKGAEGGIRAVGCHPSQNVVASCGLDRHLYLYDIDSRQLIHKFYVKSRINAMLFSRKQRPSVDDVADSEIVSFDTEQTDENETTKMSLDVTDTDEVLWSHMQPVKSSIKSSKLAPDTAKDDVIPSAQKKKRSRKSSGKSSKIRKTT